MDHRNTTTNSNNNNNNSNNNNPYLVFSPLPANGQGQQGIQPTDKIFDALNRYGKRFEDATRKVESYADSIWHHLKTSPSVTDAAVTRLAQGTKVLTEGGYDKVFQKTFSIMPGDKFLKAFACYLYTSNGPLIGTLYVSTKRIAFCSDNPLKQYLPTGQQQLVYYKVVVPVEKLAAVTPSTKYINILTIDGHEFWFTGFISYANALKHLSDALQPYNDTTTRSHSIPVM